MFQAQDKLLFEYICKTETKGKIQSKSNKRKCKLDYNYTDLPLFINGREIQKKNFSKVKNARQRC